MMQQALDLGHEAGEILGGGAVERWRDEGLVENDLLVGTDLGDAGKAEADEAGPVRSLGHEAQPQLADLDPGGSPARDVAVTDLLLVDGKARRALGGVGGG